MVGWLSEEIKTQELDNFIDVRSPIGNRLSDIYAGLWFCPRFCFSSSTNTCRLSQLVHWQAHSDASYFGLTVHGNGRLSHLFHRLDDICCLTKSFRIEDYESVHTRSLCVSSLYALQFLPDGVKLSERCVVQLEFSIRAKASSLFSFNSSATVFLLERSS